MSITSLATHTHATSKHLPLRAGSARSRHPRRSRATHPIIGARTLGPRPLSQAERRAIVLETMG